MRSCRLCHRSCGIDRTKRAGRCGVTETIRAARAALHFWEEPCISGSEGSGAVFFSGCPMGCVFCQNHDIALGRSGQEITEAQLADIYLQLQAQHANNINLVTPTQFVPQIVNSVEMGRAEGLVLPVVYNTGSYEMPETIHMLKETVDIFLPDLKFYDPELSKRYIAAPDYFEAAAAAIDEMVKQVGEPVFDERGMLQKGVIVRHLILPGHTKDSRRILKYLYRTYGNAIYISIMNQYTPMPGIAAQDPQLGRTLTKREYERVLDYALDLGIEQAFVQEGGTAKDSFIPAFDGTGIL